MHGHGEYTWSDGATYVGEFEDGKKHSPGSANVFSMDSKEPTSPDDKHGATETVALSKPYCEHTCVCGRV